MSIFTAIGMGVVAIWLILLTIGALMTIRSALIDRRRSRDAATGIAQLERMLGKRERSV